MCSLADLALRALRALRALSRRGVGGLVKLTAGGIVHSRAGRCGLRAHRGANASLQRRPLRPLPTARVLYHLIGRHQLGGVEPGLLRSPSIMHDALRVLNEPVQEGSVEGDTVLLEVFNSTGFQHQPSDRERRAQRTSSEVRMRQ